MKPTDRWKIRQIIPAQPGWKAVYAQEAANNQIMISQRTIICWALVEALGTAEPASTEVRAVVQESNYLLVVGDSIDVSEPAGSGATGKLYFLGFNDPEAHKESDYWVEQAKGWLKLDHAKTVAS